MQRRRMAGLALGVGLLLGLGACSKNDETRVETSTGPSASGLAIWAHALGADGRQAGWHIGASKTGELVLVGTMEGSVNFGDAGTLKAATKSDIFVAWLGQDGKIKRARRFGDSGRHVPVGMVVDAQGGVVISGLADGNLDFGGGPLADLGGGDAFVAALGPNGEFRYALRVGDAMMQNGGEIALAEDGSVYWSGSFDGSINIGGHTLTSAGNSDVFVARIDKTGKVLWAKSLGGPGTESDGSLVIDTKGQVVLSGYYEGAPDLGKGALPDTGQADGEMVVALDTSGKVLWAKGAPNKTGFFGFAMQAGESATYLVGSVAGSIDFLGSNLTAQGSTGEGLGVVQIDSAGKVLRADVYPVERLGQVYTAPLKGGGLVLSGHFQGSIDLGGKKLTSEGEEDLFVAWMNTQGRIERAERLGGKEHERIGDMAITPDGHIALTGMFEGTMNLGSGDLTSAKGPDAFVALLRK
ncbi:hypothetical protein [Polyangium spumosum]|uniref:PQQ-binding-like beta-propeller repeat protein n=1 Tax=Polyangium spumosum TaxID=889282 RepID=A0A6N7Q4V5_9BACT|nr:hypothetical protein [Polyangium spumosum]MRG97920.1 hypothetical protein [Polyangium spumosum]